MLMYGLSVGVYTTRMYSIIKHLCCGYCMYVRMYSLACIACQTRALYSLIMLHVVLVISFWLTHEFSSGWRRSNSVFKQQSHCTSLVSCVQANTGLVYHLVT